MRRTLLGALLLALLTMLAVSPPALAAEQLALSPDGVHWAEALPGPLFDEDLVWVPGDTETVSFYVRNQSADPAVLNVSMLATEVESLMDTGELTISARADGDPWVGVTTAGPHTLVPDVELAPHAMSMVQVRVAFDPEAVNQSQGRRFDLDLGITLHQQAVGTSDGEDDPGDGDTPSGLPDTGSPLSPSLLLLAVVLLAAGVLLVLLGRRRSDEEEAR